jgi:hypothetical protein
MGKIRPYRQKAGRHLCQYRHSRLLCPPG